MVVFSPFVLLLCTLWEPCARFFNKYSAFTDQKKKVTMYRNPNVDSVRAGPQISVWTSLIGDFVR